MSDWAVTAGTWWGLVEAPDAEQACLQVLAKLRLAHRQWDRLGRRWRLAPSKPRVMEFVHARPATPADRLAWAELRAADGEPTVRARVAAVAVGGSPNPEQARLL
jgi:hypothetical protein